MKITFHNTTPFYSGHWGFLAQAIVMTLAALLADALLPSVRFDSLGAAIISAILISLLNNFLRPILIVLTLPFMIFSLGLFLFIVNACIILLASAIIPSFHVDSFGGAILFSILLTAFNYLLEIPNRIMRHPKYQERESDNDKQDEYADYEEITDSKDNN